MADKKYLLLSLDDEKAKHLADVLGNKTCKRIIDVLAEKNEASEKDLADELSMPINTVEYNLKKLMDADIVEKSKKFFWSTKGKKIPMYKLSNKSIIISPKSRISSQVKSILPVALISGLAAVGVRAYYGIYQATRSFESYSNEAALYAQDSASKMVQGAAEGFAESAPSVPSYSIPPESLLIEPTTAAWFFLSGAIFALVIFLILNWRKV